MSSAGSQIIFMFILSHIGLPFLVLSTMGDVKLLFISHICQSGQELLLFIILAEKKDE